MNEITDPRDNQDVALASRPAPSVMHLSILRESPETDHLYMAIAIAQASFVSPKRNRRVDVVKNGVKLYSFKYATLDSINDMMREHLAANKLALIQPPVTTGARMALLTKVVHYASGQWLEFEIPLTTPSANDPQGWASLLTYFRRYATSSLLNIAADEDDDGNRAVGRVAHDVVDGPPPPLGMAMPRVDDPLVRDWMKQIQRMATRQPDENASDIDYLLDYWLRILPELEAKVRGKLPDVWRFICTQVRDAVARVLGPEVALLFSQPTAALNAAEWTVVDSKLLTKWSTILTKLAGSSPETHARIARNIEMQRARFPQQPEKDAGLSESAKALQDILARTDKPEQPVAKPAEPERSPDPRMPPFSSALYDETGEQASDVIEDPVKFITAFIKLRDAAFPADREMVIHNNSDAVAEAYHYPGVPELLEAAPVEEPKDESPPPAPELLLAVPPRSAEGHIQLAAYLSLLSGTLSLVTTAGGRHAWIDANDRTIAGLPTSTKIRAIDRANKRFAELGLPLWTQQ